MEGVISDTASAKKPTVYLPPLDGLRFFAFLLVFIHHMPSPPNSKILSALHSRGWAGVDLFFVISSFLLFKHLAAEKNATGTVNVGWFYLRRILRIYPLAVAFPAFVLAVMLATQPPVSQQLIGRFIGFVTLSDNVLCAVSGYSRLPYTAHLWTLSYEFQVYAVLPLAFLLWGGGDGLRTRRFLFGLASIAGVSILMRAGFILSGVHHPLIWVTPFLRPESTIVGMVLATTSIGFVGRFGIFLFGAISAVFVGLIDNVQVQGANLIFLYPAIAMVGGSLVWLATNTALKRVLAVAPLAYLGRISFGLYVYHLAAIGLTRKMLAAHGISSYALQFTVALGATIFVAYISYELFERSVESYKQRFANVIGRPMLTSTDIRKTALTPAE